MQNKGVHAQISDTETNNLSGLSDVADQFEGHIFGNTAQASGK